MTSLQTDASLTPSERIDRIEKKALLSTLWIFVLLNFFARDIHEFGKAETIEQVLTGTYNGIVITEGMFLIGGLMIEIPIAMVLMSRVLPLAANRWANMVAAPLWGLTLIGMATDLDDYFHFALIVVALATIVWQAWGWSRSTLGATD